MKIHEYVQNNFVETIEFFFFFCRENSNPSRHSKKFDETQTSWRTLFGTCMKYEIETKTFSTSCS